MTATGGRLGASSSPQLKSMPMSIEKKKNESEAVPWACQRVGPSRVSLMSTP
jgi:hypothetical protein